MFIGKVYRFICGYVEFTAVGDNPESILNSFFKNRIFIWNVRRTNGCITACVGAHNYKKIHSLRKKGQKTRVVKKYGIPFFAKKYRCRYGMLVGAIIFSVLMFFLPTRIWNIEICGNGSIPTETISNALNSLGVYEGVRVSSLNTGVLKSQLPLKIPDIAWAAVNIDGMKVTVEISETQKSELKNDPPCNLKASRDGIIKSVLVNNGRAEVIAGQSVAKGDVLVSGVAEYKDTSIEFKTADGVVTAEVEREFKVYVPFKKVVAERTGKSEKRTVIRFMQTDIPLFIGKVKYDHDKKLTEYRYNKNGSYIPITFKSAKFYETKNRTYFMSYDEAVAEADIQLKNYILTDKNVISVISQSDEIQKSKYGITVTRLATLEENIAIPEIILFSTVN